MVHTTLPTIQIADPCKIARQCPNVTHHVLTGDWTADAKTAAMLAKAVKKLVK